MHKKIIISGALLGGLSVVLGAFGAHALKNQLPTEVLQSFETGVRYQMYHALALIAIANFFDFKTKLQVWMYRFFLWGTILFSGSIYLLSLDQLINVQFNFLGPITPLGGLLLILGWILLAINAYKKTAP